MRREGRQCGDGLVNLFCQPAGECWVSPGVERDCHRELVHPRGLAREARIEQLRDRRLPRAAEGIEVRHGADEPPGLGLGAPRTAPADYCPSRSRGAEDDGQNCAAEDTRRDEPSPHVVLRNHLERVRAGAGNCTPWPGMAGEVRQGGACDRHHHGLRSSDRAETDDSGFFASLHPSYTVRTADP
jgi:hypothetical protein